MIGFDAGSINGMLDGLWSGGGTVDFSHMDPFQFFLFVIAAIILAAALLTDKGGNGGRNDGKEYKASDVRINAIDKASDSFVVTLNSDGRTLFKGTREECNRWKREHCYSEMAQRMRR